MDHHHGPKVRKGLSHGHSHGLGGHSHGHGPSHDYSHDHPHDHPHPHGDQHDKPRGDDYVHRPLERKRLLIAMALTGAMMVAEIVYGVISNSLALIGDAGHMLTHFAALAVSWLAILIASRPRTDKRTYGLYRAEVLAALFNGAFVVLITLYIFYEAYARFISPEPINNMQMLVVAIAGLIVNLVTAWVLFDASKEDLNVKSAFIHLIGDTLSSVGIVAAGVVIYFTGWTFLDPLVAAVLGLIILYWAYHLIKDALHILLESVPRDIDLKELRRCVQKDVPAIKDIHDVHVWQITSGMYSMTAHVAIQDAKISQTTKIMEDIQQCLDHHFHINHVTIQFEPHRKSTTMRAAKEEGET